MSHRNPNPELATPSENARALVRGGIPAGGLDQVQADRLVRAFLAGRNERTMQAYARDLEDFSGFLGAHSSATVAAAYLVSLPHGEANAVVLEYRAELRERGLAAATINRRLAAIRSVVTLARTLGMVDWALDVRGLKAEPYRDTSGPGRGGYRAMLEQLDARGDDPKARRDRAMLRLLYDLALRRAEVVGLDLEDLDLKSRRVMVLGKGQNQKEPRTLPEPTTSALRLWLEIRGIGPGPLFLTLDPAGKGDGRLTGTSLYRIVRSLGAKAGVSARPHGLRHSAITEALDLTRGDVRAVQRFSRHKDLRVLNVYDDNRQDLAGDVARLVAEASTQQAG